MDQPIVSISYVFNMGRAAAARGDKRDSHEFNWHAPCLPTWLKGFDSVRNAQASPACHIAPHRLARIDLAHTAAHHPHIQGA